MQRALQFALRIFFDLLYGRLAWTYDAVAWVVSLGRWQTWVAAVLRELSGPRVLELGHGPGYLQVAMRNQGLDAAGADLSAQMGRLAATRLRRKAQEPRLVRADGRRLPFAAASFDQLVATFPTEYITEPSMLGEAHRLLAAGGSFVLLPVAWITGRSILQRLAAALFRVTGQAQDWDGRYSAAIRNAGFSVEEKRTAVSGSEVMLLVCRPL